MGYSFLLSLFLCNIILPAQSPERFEPDQNLRRLIKKEVWKELEKATPKNQTTYVAFSFLGKMPYNSYEKLAAKEGLSPNDVATAYTFFKVVAWEWLNGVMLDSNQRKALYQQTKDELLAKLANKTNAEKQKLADPSILKATWTNLTLQKALTDEDQVATTNITSTVQRWFFEMTGKLIAEVTLGSNGFADKGIAATTSSDIKTSNKPVSTKGSTVAHTPSKAPNDQSATDVQDVIMRTITSYGLNGVFVANEVYILFKNGEIYNEPINSPYKLNRAAFKREKPKGWGTWKKQGNKLVTTYPGKGKTYEWEKWFQVRPGTQGFKIEGKFQSIDPFGGSVVLNANTVAFSRQGQFAWKSVKGGQTAWLPVYSKKSTAGTYEIKDYSIVLNYNGGQKEELFFGRYPKSETHFIIGVGHFVPLDN